MSDVKQSAPRSGWGRRAIVGAVALVAVAGVGVVAAVGSDGDRGAGMRGAMAGEFAEFRLERMLDRVEATPEQTERVRAIFAGARDELLPMAGGMREARAEAARLLTAPTIDRAAAERLRAERVADLDRASQRLTTALLDMAEVLTPEQRTEVLEAMQERGRFQP